MMSRPVGEQAALPDRGVTLPLQPMELAAADLVWEPYNSTRGGTLRIRSTSCCGAVELAFRAGQYLVLRSDGEGGYEETSRGTRHRAVAAYTAVVREHWQTHANERKRHSIRPERA